MMEFLEAGKNAAEFLSVAVCSGAVYELFKCQMSITANNLKKKLKGWLFDDNTIDSLANELNMLKLSDEMSELAIQKRLATSPQIMSLLKHIRAGSEKNIIIQRHYGKGDNVGRDKIMH